MRGASEHVRRVKALNATWTPSPDGGDGLFEVLVITDDDRRHAMAASPASMAALVALSRADTALAFDTTRGILMAADIAGRAPLTVESHEPAHRGLDEFGDSHASGPGRTRQAA